MKKIALLLSIMLSTCNIVCAQGIFDNLFGGGVKKEISSNVEEAYNSFIGISEMGSPEQIMRQNNFAFLCEIGNMPQSYGSACFLKANGSYNHADTAEYYLADSVVDPYEQHEPFARRIFNNLAAIFSKVIGMFKKNDDKKSDGEVEQDESEEQ
jgi:hypothetical protein